LDLGRGGRSGEEYIKRNFITYTRHQILLLAEIREVKMGRGF